jgi:formate dehydrogenase major subunit
MHDDGLGWLWVTSGLKDGPLPVHYEPLESPVANSVYRQETNPAANRHERPDNTYAEQSDARYPHVLTTYRLTEHHTAGGMSRTLSRLAELQPELFCEISPELADANGITNGSFVRVTTPRASIRARALVTGRMRPLVIDGRIVHQVGMPYHWGGRGLVTGDVVNDLIPMSEEPNVRIMEAKALVCRVEPVEPVEPLEPSFLPSPRLSRPTRAFHLRPPGGRVLGSAHRDEPDADDPVRVRAVRADRARGQFRQGGQGIAR